MSSIDLEAHPEGVVLPVRASAGARREGVRGEQDGALKVSVVQVAEQGRANQALAVSIARALGLRRSQVELLSGATSTRKRFLLRGVHRAAIAERLAALVASS